MNKEMHLEQAEQEYAESVQEAIEEVAATWVAKGMGREEALSRAHDAVNGALEADHDPTGVQQLLPENQIPALPADTALRRQVAAIARDLKRG
ncbi:hypothetical protein [Stenotrophomonas tumulicola]|uniref:Uncharacterized protein n=1 Tax=Stenotrophomonas tumulicola TaxID=1685415 RepID=A0A7W3FIL8_9GAMM|nr:hypothetical protein [Stenotrophomonas tumulicola]MBA8680203.1 hypothetical protein [Stenotrophomonas tumulicola]